MVRGESRSNLLRLLLSRRQISYQSALRSGVAKRRPLHTSDKTYALRFQKVPCALAGDRIVADSAGIEAHGQNLRTVTVRT